MGKRESRYWNLSTLRGIVFVILSVVFVFGGIGGCMFARLADGQGAQELHDYLTGYLQLIQTQEASASFWSVFWLQGRYFLAAALLGLTAIGVVGFPLLFGLRGFLLSFSIAGCYRVFGVAGLWLALILFGISAFFWLPALFFVGVQGLAGSIMLVRRGLGDMGNPLPFCMPYWKRLAFAIALLLAGILLEYWVVPLALKSVVQMI